MRKTHLIGLVAMLVISDSGMAMTTQPPGIPPPDDSGKTQAGERHPASDRKTITEPKDKGAGQEETKANAKQQANKQED